MASPAAATNLLSALLVFALILLFTLLSSYTTPDPNLPEQAAEPEPEIRTTLSHVAFGLAGTLDAWPRRRGYLEAWWRRNLTRGYLYLDRVPTPDLLPWPAAAPPYRVLGNPAGRPGHARMVQRIADLFAAGVGSGVRWFVLGDDDTVFFVDNLVDMLSGYDHRKYYYIGWRSEYVVSNFLSMFEQAFGGGGVVVSYAVARAVAEGVDGCLERYRRARRDDLILMACVCDIGVGLTPHKGFHQMDLRGDVSGYLSVHPNVHLMSLHNLDSIDPIFPSMDHIQSVHHLMKAAGVDQSHLLQQTICYHPTHNWSFSISWGYSIHIYESVITRSYLNLPIETFMPLVTDLGPPFYMFNTRRPAWNDSCMEPHVFLFESVYKSISRDQFITSYLRTQPRGLQACSLNGGNYSADLISRIEVHSSIEKRIQVDRCECCDVVRVIGSKAEIRLRNCREDEII